MIDTITLTFKANEFKVFNYRIFQETAFQGLKRYYRAVYNTDPDTFGYSLKLTLYRRAGVEELRSEFSAPKALFGNNFDELSEEDFTPLINKLQNDLLSLNIRIDQANFTKASVAKIDYSKNIIFTDGTKPSQILNELSKVDLKRTPDIEEIKYRNKGHCLHLKHTNSFDFVVYDKIADLKRAKISDKRAVKRENNGQLSLLDFISEKEPFEVLRVEARLVNRAKIRQMLEIINIQTGLTFQELFNKGIAIAVLKMIWSELVNGLEVASIKEMNEADLLVAILNNNEITMNQALRMVAVITIAQKGSSIDLKRIVKESGYERAFSGLDKAVRSLNLPKNNRYKAICGIAKSIEEFKSVKLADYPQLKFDM